MKYTNKHNLPQTLVNLTERDGYSKGAARISVTTLIGSPKISILRNRHDDEIVTDVADGLWALVGRAIHHVAEAGADAENLSEERLFAEVNGWVLSGGIDLQVLSDGVSILDYKFTSAWAVMNAADKGDWETQLNCYAWLVHKSKGTRVKGLQICALVRDWRRHDVGRVANYPEAPAKVIDVPLWSYDRQTAYIEERVRLHQEAASSAEFGDDLPRCTDEERWVRGEKFAVIKGGNKKATKVFDTLAEADHWFSSQPPGTTLNYEVVHRPGEPLRCTGNYCRVSSFCKQYGEWVIENKMGDQ